MKTFIEEMKVLINKYNEQNDCIIESIGVDTTIHRALGKRKIVSYNLIIKVNG